MVGFVFKPRQPTSRVYTLNQFRLWKEVTAAQRTEELEVKGSDDVSEMQEHGGSVKNYGLPQVDRTAFPKMNTGGTWLGSGASSTLFCLSEYI